MTARISKLDGVAPTVYAISRTSAPPAILRALTRAARLVVTRAIRVVDVCADCGFDCDPADEPTPTGTCHPHGMVIAKQPLYGMPPGRDRAAEMVTFAAREVLTVADAPADDRAACRMALDNDAEPVLGEQVVRAYQRMRREGRL